MLCITRKDKERIIFTVPGLAEPIIVQVLDRANQRVRLGVTAPRSVLIEREEINTRRRAKNDEVLPALQAPLPPERGTVLAVPQPAGDTAAVPEATG